MAISLEAHPTLPQGFVKINGTTGATVTTSGIGPATSIAAGTVLPTGIISAQSALKTDTQVATGGAGIETDITGLSLSVVVPSATAKVLLLGYVTQTGLYTGFRIKRNGTDVGLGDAAGTRTRILVAGGDEAFNANVAKTTPINFLDSPNAAGTYTYKITAVAGLSTTPFINRSPNDSDSTFSPRGTSQLIALVIP